MSAATNSAAARRIASARPKIAPRPASGTTDFRFQPSHNLFVSQMLAALLLVASVTAPLWANPGLLFIMGLTLIEALFVLSWYFLFGYAGVVSFGHAAFFGVGAYFAGALLKTAPDWSFLVLLFGAGVFGAALAWLVGIIALKRSSGMYLAILTMSLAEICRTLISYSTFLGRDDGLSAIPRPFLNLLGLRVNLESDVSYYWFIWITVVLLTCLIWWIAHSRFGRALRCIQLDLERASFIGVNVARWQLGSFVLSGALAALAGALMAPWTQIVTPEVTNLFHSTQPILSSLLGGVHSFWGPIVGAIAFAAINYFTRALAGLSEIVVGLILLVIVLGAPDGLVGLFTAIEKRSKALFGQARAQAAQPRHVPVVEK